jgi:predicted transport protein
MAKTSGELEKEFLDTAKQKTGRNIEAWLSMLKASGIRERKDRMEWLKKGHGLNHLQAQFIVGISLNNGKPVYINENALLENHFSKCEGMRPLFDVISEKIFSTFQGTQLIPKKTYLSFIAIREFAAINIKPTEIRLGLDLGDEPFTDMLQKSNLVGPMPRISHMLIITESSKFDNRVMELLNQSFNRTNTK